MTLTGVDDPARIPKTNSTTFKFDEMTPNKKNIIKYIFTNWTMLMIMMMLRVKLVFCDGKFSTHHVTANIVSIAAVTVQNT
jgi:hypothetical protein